MGRIACSGKGEAGKSGNRSSGATMLIGGSFARAVWGAATGTAGVGAGSVDSATSCSTSWLKAEGALLTTPLPRLTT